MMESADVDLFLTRGRGRHEERGENVQPWHYDEAPMRRQGTPVGRKLASTAKTVSTAFSAALADEGGSIPTWLILDSLRRQRSVTQHDLARSLGIEGPTVARHLGNLEQRGYLTRERSDTDRRAIGVEITDQGEQAYQRMLGAVIAFNKRLQQGLTRADLDQLDQILTRLASNVEP
jgi:MarR family transcriptional regulator for hemolysin